MCQNSTSSRRLLAEEDSESATQHQSGKQGRERDENATWLHCDSYLLPRRGLVYTATFNRYETIENTLEIAANIREMKSSSRSADGYPLPTRPPTTTKH